MSKDPKPLDVYEFANTVAGLFRDIEDRFDRTPYIKTGELHRYVTRVYVDSDGDLIIEGKL